MITLQKQTHGFVLLLTDICHLVILQYQIPFQNYTQKIQYVNLHNYSQD